MDKQIPLVTIINNCEFECFAHGPSIASSHFAGAGNYLEDRRLQGESRELQHVTCDGNGVDLMIRSNDRKQASQRLFLRGTKDRMIRLVYEW